MWEGNICEYDNKERGKKSFIVLLRGVADYASHAVCVISARACTRYVQCCAYNCNEN